MGKGRWTKYALPAEAEKLSQRASAKLKNNKALDEDRVYAKLKDRVPGIKSLSSNVEHILSYGFTEMLNNAIDHSKSKSINVGIKTTDDIASFSVVDNGIGVFRNLMQKRNLANELEAIQDLTKGKITTMKQGHSGEGIFFTSRGADLFILESYGYRIRVDNRIPDLFVERIDRNEVKGTKVEFQISKSSTKEMGEIFRKYQLDDDSDFDVTEIKVKLYKEDVTYISRSQAKRLLTDLDKFKRIILDFDKVATVGQGFADEIFRVFQSNHPDIELISINMSEEVSFMVNRVEKPNPELF
jgi:hypothetical protein